MAIEGLDSSRYNNYIIIIRICMWLIVLNTHDITHVIIHVVLPLIQP